MRANFRRLMPGRSCHAYYYRCPNSLLERAHRINPSIICFSQTRETFARMILGAPKVPFMNRRDFFRRS